LRRVCLVLLALLAFFGTANAQVRPRAVASFSILADMLGNIAGEAFDVVSIVGPEADAHAFQPTPSDARKLVAAKILVVNGLGFEGWIERLAKAAPFGGRQIVASKGVQPLTMQAKDEKRSAASGRAVVDPHCWQDLACGRAYVANIAEGLAAADPGQAEIYRSRAAAYTQRLAGLDRWVRDEIARVPAEKRKVITGHDAFGYFARAYGVAFHAPVGISTEDEPSAKSVAALIAQVRRDKIRAIFMENMTNPALVQQVARDSGGVIGPTLYVDALSKPDGPAPTYEAMFRHNVTALVAGMLRN